MTPVEVARSLLGARWIHQGRDPAIGIDCAGLLLIAFGSPHDLADYPRHPYAGQLESQLERHFGPPAFDGPRVGDAVAMSYGEKGVIRHCGIVGDYIHGGLSLIHTDSIVGCVTEHPLDDFWLARVRQVYR